MSEEEYIVETESGSYYHLKYHKGLISSDDMMECFQIAGKDADPRVNYDCPMRPHELLPGRILGMYMQGVKGIGRRETSPIVKVYKRIL